MKERATMSEGSKAAFPLMGHTFEVERGRSVTLTPEGGLTKLELGTLMIAQGIMANSQLHAEFWKDYQHEAAEIGAAEAAMNIERRIAYRARRVASVVLGGDGDT
jgi:hypothetical protein